MKKIILLAGLVAGGVALSVTASANNWLLYLPAILAGSGGTTTEPTVESNKWLLYLPAILAGSGSATSFGLNDTGIVTALGSSGKEDAAYGRDVSDGGFSFTKLAADDGSELADGEGSWGCVRDNVTGLVWADQDAWDTANWSTALGNATTYANCGISAGNWRLPTPKELLSIVAYNLQTNSVDGTYFRLPSSSIVFWTMSESVDSSGNAWYVGFASNSGTSGGYLENVTTEATIPFRLVHGADSSAQLIDNPDGTETVIDQSTNLIWQKCLVGYSGSGCSPTGGTTAFTWPDALELDDGEWRLPNIKELQSLVDYQASSPAINSTIFPGVPSDAEVWSNSPVTGSSGQAWIIKFASGHTSNADTSTTKYVRLVKDAP